MRFLDVKLIVGAGAIAAAVLSQCFVVKPASAADSTAKAELVT